mmetsp:Transcript_29121/g.84208  ORF Transcript_29121/g.84208 Transcript_29121/m.84208 type:complete len:97 (+) Transcript_29121:490-780(+)
MRRGDPNQPSDPPIEASYRKCIEKKVRAEVPGENRTKWLDDEQQGGGWAPCTRGGGCVLHSHSYRVAHGEKEGLDGILISLGVLSTSIGKDKDKEV